MAANNYFGFPAGGAQYSAQPATAYPAAAPTAYVAQPAHQAAYATAAPRAAQSYDAYQTTHTAGQYAYATRTQVVVGATPAYESTKTYYAAAAAAPAAAAAVYTVAETPYQAYITGGSVPITISSSTSATSPYVTTSYTAPTQQRQVTSAKVHTPTQNSQSYVYATNSAAQAPSGGSSYNTGSTTSSYDAALYSAATNYYQQQQTPKTGVAWQSKKVFTPKLKPKMPPKTPQLHYCEVCKISCAGPQTYREHLEGQKHKKKEIALKTGTTNPSSIGRGVQTQLRCELCDVACTGADAYAAHIRGAKHQKVLKLHTKLGKPIPSTEPMVLTNSSTGTTTTAKASTLSSTTTSKTATKMAPPVVPGTRKVVATPKITFVGGTQLKTTGVKEEKPDIVKTEPDVKPNVSVEETKPDVDSLFGGDKDVQPVGHEYIEEVRNEVGTVISFHCKLCECKFNDPNAKIMHMKGRRHRLQYKKKVDPSLSVEIKPSIRMRKIQEDRMRRQAVKEEYWMRRDAEEQWREEMRMMMHYEEGMYHSPGGWQGPAGRGGNFPPHGNMPGGPIIRRPDSSDDRHVMSKHTMIYPNEAELQSVQQIVSNCEKALKQVSDFLSESDAKPVEVKKELSVKKDAVVKKDPGLKKDGKEEAAVSDSESKPETPPPMRALKGVMRVGVLAKGLLLHNDLSVHLVVLCSEKPTRTLLVRVADNLPKQLAIVAPDEKFDVKICVEEAAVIVSASKEPKTVCTVTFTSPVMRDENTGATEGEGASSKLDPPDVLDRQKCLEALAALRHAKWFQARANGLQSCVVIIRILRDLCQRVPTWSPLPQWSMELLVEKCLGSGGPNMTPGDSLRRVFECMASGILLPGGPGLHDPCEKEMTDAAGSLTNQEREDLTASAQHALRLIAFRQIHKVLGMDPLPAPRFQPGKRFQNPRKRRLSNGAGEGCETEAGGDGKKDKRVGEGEDAGHTTS
ncbi:hypothetical protein NP493_1432g00005 [Ridgeia piscesae]|uniref:DZF domain-containing protein n=1 Tax=Ridgeia piscesae TaxID=27915 RepID=A0AAD9K3X1_RIDPI|nr:hypothetical protein NP493_1432g00005 [Ridgeia piscesae]